MAYIPEPPTFNDLDELTAYLRRELERISAAIDMASAFSVPMYNAAPPKPREWMLAGADGVSWDPGSGKGVYVYLEGSWTKVQTS